ncbi:hypothetical protein B566_EDAN006903 [Ephemera danica]|nr:hypothetical protein B566_EDAN006903 [Ephemera danica]
MYNNITNMDVARTGATSCGGWYEPPRSSCSRAGDELFLASQRYYDSTHMPVHYVTHGEQSTPRMTVSPSYPPPANHYVSPLHAWMQSNQGSWPGSTAGFAFPPTPPKDECGYVQEPEDVKPLMLQPREGSEHQHLHSESSGRSKRANAGKMQGT